MNRTAATALAGIAYMVLAGACFAALDTTTKYVVSSVPVLMCLWVRYTLQAAFSTAMLLPFHGRSLLRTRHLKLQLLRGLLLVSSTALAIYGVRVMPVGEFTAIVMVTPLAVNVLAVTLLKEKIRPLSWLFVIGGFTGTLIIVRPGGHSWGWSVLLPLGCMATSSAFQLLSSHLGKMENPATTHFYTGWVGAGLATLLLPIAWVSVDSSLLRLLMVLIGVMAAVGHFLLALAYKHAPAATLMPYLYCQLGFAVLASWIVFDHVPDGWAGIGMGLIALSGVCAAWLKARENRAAASLPPA